MCVDVVGWLIGANNAAIESAGALLLLLSDAIYTTQSKNFVHL